MLDGHTWKIRFTADNSPPLPLKEDFPLTVLWVKKVGGKAHGEGREGGGGVVQRENMLEVSQHCRERSSSEGRETLKFPLVMPIGMFSPSNLPQHSSSELSVHASPLPEPTVVSGTKFRCGSRKVPVSSLSFP